MPGSMAPLQLPHHLSARVSAKVPEKSSCVYWASALLELSWSIIPSTPIRSALAKVEVATNS